MPSSKPAGCLNGSKADETQRYRRTRLFRFIPVHKPVDNPVYSGMYSGMINTDTIQITPELLALLSEIDEFAPTTGRRSALRNVGDAVVLVHPQFASCKRCAPQGAAAATLTVEVKQHSLSPIVRHKVSRVRGAALRSRAFSFAKTCSIGLKSCEYAGSNIKLAPVASIAARTASLLWLLNRSAMTI